MKDQSVVVHIPHKLGKDEAVRRLKHGLETTSSKLPFLKIEREEWTGEKLTFSVSGFGQAASGSAEVSNNDVRIEVSLPWIFQRLAGITAATLRSRTKLLLEKK